MFGYADESGEPGVKKSDHDYFVFCIVLFKDRQAAEKCSNKIDEFRQIMGLPDGYELHFSNNPKNVKAEFVKFLKKIDFEFLSISIKKTSHRNDASYMGMAELVLEILSRKHIAVNIEMDKNPGLYRELRKKKKLYDTDVHFAEKESRGNNLIQLADYVTALRTRALKYPQKSGTVEMYGGISKKVVGIVEI